MTAKYTNRVRPDLLRDVVELEKEENDVSFLVTLSIEDYEAERNRGQNVEEIYEKFAWAHDTPTMKELSDEYLTEGRMQNFVHNFVHASRRVRFHEKMRT